jgi:hypothetical protein
MDWITALYFSSSVTIVAAISLWLRSIMLRSNGANFLCVQLAVVGFALITSGTILWQLNYEPRYFPGPGTRLLHSFGFLFVVAGLIVLFILSCLSRGRAPAVSKPTAEHENSMGEYLR